MSTKKTPVLGRDSRNSVMQISSYRTAEAVDVADGGSMYFNHYDILRLQNIGDTAIRVGVVPMSIASTYTVSGTGTTADGDYTFLAMFNGKPQYKHNSINCFLDWSDVWAIVNQTTSDVWIHPDVTGDFAPLTGWVESQSGGLPAPTLATQAVIGTGMSLAPYESLHSTVPPRGTIMVTGGVLNVCSLGN